MHTVWHFATKCAAVDILKPCMSSHFSEQIDSSYVGSATWPECPVKDWRGKSGWLHSRASGPEIDQGPGGLNASTLFGPVLEPAELSEIVKNRGVFRVLLRLLPPRPSWGKADVTMHEWSIDHQEIKRMVVWVSFRVYISVAFLHNLFNFSLPRTEGVLLNWQNAENLLLRLEGFIQNISPQIGINHQTFKERLLKSAWVHSRRQCDYTTMILSRLAEHGTNLRLPTVATKLW